MASAAFHLMETYYARVKEANSRNAFDEAFVWNLCESAVNNVHHGLPVSEWVPKLIRVLNSDLENESDAALKAVWREAVSMAEAVLTV